MVSWFNGTKLNENILSGRVRKALWIKQLSDESMCQWQMSPHRFFPYRGCSPNIPSSKMLFNNPLNQNANHNNFY